jgi:hypothetical protein
LLPTVGLRPCRQLAANDHPEENASLCHNVYASPRPPRPGP